MATMNISLPDSLRSWIEGQLAAGRFASTSDYVRDLVRRDQDYRAELAALEAALEEGRNSGPSGRSVEDIITAERARLARAA